MWQFTSAYIQPEVLFSTSWWSCFVFGEQWWPELLGIIVISELTSLKYSELGRTWPEWDSLAFENRHSFEAIEWKNKKEEIWSL